MMQGLGPHAKPNSITSTSPPIVVGDVVVVGATFPSSTTRKESPPGDVRGVGPRTGEILWAFHVVPRPGELGHETWKTVLGSTPATQGPGPRSRQTRSSGTSTCRRRRLRLISTVGTDPGTIFSPRAWCA